MSNTQIDADIALLATYIEDGPVLYRFHISRLVEEMLRRCAGYELVAEIGYAALAYTEACCRLEATTDNLARHDLRTPDMDALTSALLQNKEAARKRFNTALTRYKARQQRRTRPLEPVMLNW